MSKPTEDEIKMGGPDFVFIHYIAAGIGATVLSGIITIFFESIIGVIITIFIIPAITVTVAMWRSHVRLKNPYPWT